MNATRERFSAERVLPVVIMLLSGAGLILGWKLFWFLTDDAYIAFRYVSNSHLGHGYVWNPPPFMPVEGYTSFLWVALLDVTWRITGIAPPTSANYLSLAFSYGTLLLSGLMLMRIRWHDQLRQWRLSFLVLLLVFLLLNRTFLTWSSSGLETAMFDFFVLLWVCAAFCIISPVRRICVGAIAAAALALTRPDGLLYCAATLVLVLILACRPENRRRTLRILLCGLLPLSLVLAHEAWRLSYYGEWLPNTYYAKVTSPWPQSGWRYLLSFTLEYGVWFAGAVICWALVTTIARNMKGLAESARHGQRFSLLADATFTWGAPVVVTGTVLVHIGYYTLVVGGDHFEYRVYAHLLPLLFLALMWSLNRLCLRPISVTAMAATFILLSLPVPWTHWALTKNLNTRDETYLMHVPIAPHWPPVVRWYANAFDRAQGMLIYHHACIRHQEHKVFWATQVNSFISREKGMQISGKDYPVYAAACVGVPSWVLPHVFIIDNFGLNDYVIARTPPPRNKVRLMAHNRHAPEKYIESFRPNVHVEGPRVMVRERTQPMTAEDIISVEQHWREKLKTIDRKDPGEEQYRL